MIPLWYGLCLSAAAAYFGFWYGRSRNWGLIEERAVSKSVETGSTVSKSVETGSTVAKSMETGRAVSRNVETGSGGQRSRGVRVRYFGHSLSSPTGGRLESCCEGDISGVRILTTEGRLYAPVSGRILKISPRGNTFQIRADWGGDVTVRACTNEDDLLDRYFRPRVVKGEIIRRGKLLLEYDREKLCRKCEDTAVYVTVEGEQPEGVCITEKDQVKIGETILWMQRAGLT